MDKNNMNDLNSIFFSKNIISSLNKILLKECNLYNINREGKQEIVNILIKNMKLVYKSINTEKINNNNFNSIFEQFKKHSIIEASNDIKQNNILSIYQNSASDIKFKRDFNSNSSDGNKVFDRPQSTKTTSNIKKVSIQEPQKKNNVSQLDKVFKPIIDELTDQEYFNNYDTGRSSNITSNMENIQKMRQSEINMKNQRPATPDFLKSKNTNANTNTNTNINTNTINNNNNNNNDSFNYDSLAHDVNENLFSLDNIDKPLMQVDIEEDNSSFEDRFKRLQSDRNNVSSINTSLAPQKIDFTNDNFPKSDNLNNNVINYNNDILKKELHLRNSQQEFIKKESRQEQYNSRQEQEQYKLRQEQEQYKLRQEQEQYKLRQEQEQQYK
jgi:hypothetical protein